MDNIIQYNNLLYPFTNNDLEINKTIANNQYLTNAYKYILTFRYIPKVPKLSDLIYKIKSNIKI